MPAEVDQPKPPRTTRRNADGRSREAPEPTPPWRVEGARPAEDASGAGGEGRGAGRRWRPPGGWWFLLVALGLLALNWVLAGAIAPERKPVTIPYTFFREQVEAGQVVEVTTRGEAIQGRFRDEVAYQALDADEPVEVTAFATERPSFAEDELFSLLAEKGVVVNARPVDEARPLWETVLISFGPTVLFIALLVFAMRRLQSGMGGGIGGLGRSKATLYVADEKRTTFADVAGIEEAEDELAEVVDFLRNPDRYRSLGASIPKGVLLSGPPGTGKTLLARAVAGEADVPFFSLSASEFVEMIVGVGASRVRDLFAQAKKAAPAIVFIDELDAIGRARGGAMSFGGHDEREQTLNQILTEMDGFAGSEGVIVLAATNRPEILDQALLRPGRFDRHVVVNPPDQAGRAAILAVHTRRTPLAPDVDLERVAASTPGMVGADLRNLANEAALLAARRSHTQVAAADFSDALERIVLGAERHIMLTREERERTAYHESGHALLGMLQPGADPVRKVSIIPRGRALGVTFQSPASDRYGYDTAYLRGRIIGALGGRAAEVLVFADVTTGAENDLEQVTRIARQMVGRWGMSEAVGPISVLPDPRDEAMLPGAAGAPSEEMRRLIDAETRKIIEECYGTALALLRDHRPQLDRLAAELLARETLDEADAYAAAGIAHGEVVATT
ncbi:MAG: ATP-dependent zinc metalloprotease FtsH [Acidimicrobiales bacterium]